MNLTGNIPTGSMEELRRRIAAFGDPARWDGVVEEVSWKVHRKVVEDTPKRWTGNTRRGWGSGPKRVGGPGVRVMENRALAMAFLEHGTPRGRAGAFIYPVRKKALFVPLTRRAAFFARSKATWYTTAGSDEEREHVGEVRVDGTLTGRRSKQIVYGQDYVLAKRVRGIMPRRIAFKAQAWGQAELVLAMRGMIQKVLNG